MRRSERIGKATWEVGQFFAGDRWAGGEEVLGSSLAPLVLELPGRVYFPSLEVFELRNTLKGRTLVERMSFIFGWRWVWTSRGGGCWGSRGRRRRRKRFGGR